MFFTYHALQRMKERGLTRAKVKKAVRKGHYELQDDNTRAYQLTIKTYNVHGLTYTKYVRVITSLDAKTVVTVMQNSSFCIPQKI